MIEAGNLERDRRLGQRTRRLGRPISLVGATDRSTNRPIGFAASIPPILLSFLARSATTPGSRDQLVPRHRRRQAHLPPEDWTSLVTLARRSQSGREDLVNSRILKTLTTSISRDPGVDKVLPVWLPWVDRVTREVQSDPPTQPPRNRNTPDQPHLPWSPARRRPAVRRKPQRAHPTRPKLLPTAATYSRT